MTEERKPPPRFRRPSELNDDEIVDLPIASGRQLPPRAEPFQKLAPTQTEQLREVLGTQRKMALQLDGFGQAMNRRFDLFHQELALTRASGEEMNARLDTLIALVKGDHAPRLEKVEASLGKKAAKGGGVVALILVAAPLIADALPKYRGVIETFTGLFQ